MSERNVRGVRRKRREEKDSKVLQPLGYSTWHQEDKEAKLRQKLHHALRELRKVVKKAKTFEVQKTMRKLKDARRQDPDSDLTKDLGDQTEILKHLSYDQLARSVLMTKLKKNKTLSGDPSIQVTLAELASNLVPPGTPGTLTAKVQSRILSSKTIASEVVAIVENLRTTLHPFVRSEDIGKAPQNPLSSPNISRRKGVGPGNGGSSFKDKPSSRESNGGCEGASSDEAIAEMDDGWESGTVSGPSRSDDSMAGSADDHEDVTFDPDSTGGDSDDAAENPRKLRHPQKPKGRSEFLPSLAVGFTRGDSDSEFNDRETGLVDGIKKNRRGQRARRAIWEKRFGKNANHLKKRREQAKPTTRHGLPLDPRSGKGNPASSRRHPTSARTAHDQHKQARGPSDRVNNTGWARPDGKQDKPLHPSWEAKRKHKTGSIIPSQGTKIVFTGS